MSLRKDKAARLKLTVLEQTTRLIGKKPFDDLYVEDICDKVKISKVTLFKYFATKEDILSYYFRVWCLRRLVELRDKPKEGLQGIFYLFDKLSEDIELHPGIILGLVSYLSNPKRPLKPFPVKAEEKKFLFPGIADIQSVEIQSLDQMFERFALEAIFRKEITKATSTRDVTNLLNTIFYGGVVTSHLSQTGSLRMFLRRQVEMALKGVQ